MGWCFVCVWMGNSLFSLMEWMLSKSSLYSTHLCRCYVFSLVYRNLIAACLCWVKDVLKGFQDKNIDVNQLQNSGQISTSRQKCQEMQEVPYKDTDVENGTQPSVTFKHSGQLNIFFARNLLCRN